MFVVDCAKTKRTSGLGIPDSEFPFLFLRFELWGMRLHVCVGLVLVLQFSIKTRGHNQRLDTYILRVGKVSNNLLHVFCTFTPCSVLTHVCP